MIVPAQRKSRCRGKIFIRIQQQSKDHIYIMQQMIYL